MSFSRPLGHTMLNHLDGSKSWKGFSCQEWRTRCCLWVAEGLTWPSSPPGVQSCQVECSAYWLARYFTCFIAFNSQNNPMFPHYPYFTNKKNWGLNVINLSKVIKLGQDASRFKLTWGQCLWSNNCTRIICMALSICKVDIFHGFTGHVSSELPV